MKAGVPSKEPTSWMVIPCLIPFLWHQGTPLVLLFCSGQKTDHRGPNPKKRHPKIQTLKGNEPSISSKALAPTTPVGQEAHPSRSGLHCRKCRQKADPSRAAELKEGLSSVGHLPLEFCSMYFRRLKCPLSLPRASGYLSTHVRSLA